MDAKTFYAEVVNREEQIAELKTELKAMFDAFASSTNLTTKGIQKGLKEFKSFQKNEAEYRVTDADADLIFENLAA